MNLPTRATAASPAVFNTAFLPLIDGLQEAVWLVDARTHSVVAVNHASQQLLGLQARDLVGSSVESLASTPEDALFWMDAAIGRRESLHTDTMMRHADGRHAVGLPPHQLRRASAGRRPVADRDARPDPAAPA
ncbi:PAS domain-containing protein [Roseateles sp. UC29_93]|uniref:PAS domain-containing protein n=1 Tax=Roseateles sp. UC29_93 TaxID=3350177 RepID=UPI00366FFF8E